MHSARAALLSSGQGCTRARSSKGERRRRHFIIISLSSVALSSFPSPLSLLRPVSFAGVMRCAAAVLCALVVLASSCAAERCASEGQGSDLLRRLLLPKECVSLLLFFFFSLSSRSLALLLSLGHCSPCLLTRCRCSWKRALTRNAPTKPPPPKNPSSSLSRRERSLLFVPNCCGALRRAASLCSHLAASRKQRKTKEDKPPCPPHQPPNLPTLPNSGSLDASSPVLDRLLWPRTRQEYLETFNSATLTEPLHIARGDADYFEGLFSVEALMRLVQSYRHTWGTDIKLVREGDTVGHHALRAPALRRGRVKQHDTLPTSGPRHPRPFRRTGSLRCCRTSCAPLATKRRRSS